MSVQSRVKMGIENLSHVGLMGFRLGNELRRTRATTMAPPIRGASALREI